jgi:tetratricopeptide (TPR) repeat protein
VLKTADRYLAAAPKESQEEARLKIVLLAIDVLFAQPSPDQQRIAGLLRDAGQAVQTIAPANPAVAEYHYRRMQLAQKLNDQSTIDAAAEWIAANGVGTPYELPALVIAARAADAAAESASDADRAARQDEAAAIYVRLVELLGDSPAVLGASKNALAASSKLAQYDETRGRWPQAADRLQRLVEALPSDRRFLRRAGLATFQAGRHADSLAHWRKLLVGLESGTDEWLEAKYYHLACLLATDRPAAEKVWKQFKLLFPEVKSDAWKEKFAELEKRFT